MPPKQEYVFNILTVKRYGGLNLQSRWLKNGSQVNTIVMDIQTPKMDGYQTLARIREHGIKTPIIALTAHAMKEEQDKAASKGFTDFATKPLQREKFMELLERYKK
ncbi:MAG: response regulator [Bdellovibrionaceae bacterium]|nr:response regulator [Pseudobdellovibrionaceae bacterium]